MKKLFHGKGYIDGITIINLEGEILFTAKLNNKLSSQEEPYELVGQKFLDVYENLDPKTSTTIKAMELGLPVYIENQLLKAQGKEEIRITSLSIPIKSGKQIVGAIDLSMQESEEELEQNSERVELSYSSFPVSSSGKLVNRNTAFFTIADIIAVDEKMKKAREYISVVAACDLPVMICGETGTGKEVFAHAIHAASNRSQYPIIEINCSAFSKDLLESELFGYKAGAFTGAIKDKKGLFEIANHGTIFLDEIGEMAFDLQARLLRILETGEYIKLGDTKRTQVDVRIISATNRHLKEEIEKGEFREDLFFRLSVFQIHLPALRERKEDIESLARLFLQRCVAKFNKTIEDIDPDALLALRQAEWKGNVRELRNVIERSAVICDNRITREDLPIELQQNPYTRRDDKGDEFELAAIERKHILKVLQHTHGNKTETARLLKIGLATLYRKIESYHIQ